MISSFHTLNNSINPLGVMGLDMANLNGHLGPYEMLLSKSFTALSLTAWAAGLRSIKI